MVSKIRYSTQKFLKISFTLKLCFEGMSEMITLISCYCFFPRFSNKCDTWLGPMELKLKQKVINQTTSVSRYLVVNITHSGIHVKNGMIYWLYNIRMIWFTDRRQECARTVIIPLFSKSFITEINRRCVVESDDRKASVNCRDWARIDGGDGGYRWYNEDLNELMGEIHWDFIWIVLT